MKTLSGGTRLSWTDTSRSSGKGYFYRIVALSKLDGVTWRSVPSDDLLVYRLSTPAIQKITAGQQGFTVSWKRITGADGFLLLRSDDGAAPQIVGSTDGSLQLTDATATETGVLYTYQVVAKKTVDGHTYPSAGSLVKSACCLDAPVLDTPQQVLRGTLLQWNRVPQATGYEIYRSSNGIKWSKVKTVSGETGHWTDTSRASRKQYRYRIVAIAKLNGTIYKSPYSASVQLPS